MSGNTELQEKARQARNKYMRQYRMRNKEKIREINRRYWERRALKEEGVDNGS